MATNKKRPGVANSKATTYKTKVSAALFTKALNSGRRFQLACNVEDVGYFDDLVFQYLTPEGHWYTYLFQIKFSSQGRISLLNIIPNNRIRQRNSMIQYFYSFCDIRKNGINTLSGINILHCNVVHFTNAKIKQSRHSEYWTNRLKCSADIDNIVDLGSDKMCIFNLENWHDFDICSEQNPGVSDVDKELFLSKFKIFSGMSNLEELDNIIMKEVMEALNCNRIKAMRVKEIFLKIFLEWHENGNEILNESSLLLTRACSEFEKERFQETKFSEIDKAFTFDKSSVTELSNALTEMTTSLHIVPNETSIDLTLNKVFQVLKDEGKVFTYISQPGSQLENDDLSAWENSKENLIVISTDNAQGDIVQDSPIQEDVAEFMAKVCQVLKDNTEKEMLFISSADSPLVARLGMELGKNINKIQDSFQLRDLTADSLAKVLHHTITFQGQEVTMIDLIGDIFCRIFTPNLINFIIKPFNNKIGLEHFRVIQQISSTQNNWNVTTQMLDDRKYDISVIMNGVLRRLLPSQETGHSERWVFRPTIEKSQIQFATLPRNEVSLELQLLDDDNDDKSLLFNLDTLLDLEDRVVIVQGSLKRDTSSLLSHVAFELNKKNPSDWIIYIRFKDHYKKFENHSKAFKADEMFTSMVTFDNSSSVEMDLFQHSLKNKGNVCVIMEDFEKVSKRCLGNCETFFAYLLDTKVKQVWISTENYKDDLENIFQKSTSSVNLKRRASETCLNVDVKSCEGFVSKKFEMTLQNVEEANENYLQHLTEELTAAAVVSLLDSSSLSKIIDSNVNKLCKKLVSNVKSGKEKNPFVHLIINGKPYFEEKTYAEFFMGKWLAKCFRKEISFVRSHLYRDDFRVVRHFFDFEICIDNQLHAAVLNGDCAEVNAALKSGVDVDARDKAGRTALHLCSAAGYEASPDNVPNISITKLLLENGGDLNLHDTDILQWTPLHYAYETQTYDVMDLILAHGKPSVHDKEIIKQMVNDRLLLDVIISRGFFHILVLLLDNDLDANLIMGENLSSLMHEAAKYGHYNLIQLLIKKGGNIKFENVDGITPLDTAFLYGHVSLFEALTGRNWTSQHGLIENVDNIMHCAARGGHVAVLDLLFKSGADAESRDLSGHTLLHDASTAGHVDVADLILKNIPLSKHAEYLNACDNDGNKALHYAALEGHVNILERLLKLGGDLQESGSNGQSPLHNASSNGHLLAVEFLLNKTINLQDIRSNYVNQLNKEGDGALHLATQNGHLNVMRMLVKAGGKFEQRGSKHRTLLHHAALHGDVSLSRYLLKLFKKIHREREEICQYVNEHDAVQDTALHCAVQKGNLRELIFLHSEGGDLHARGFNGQSLLHPAALNGHLHIAEFLLKTIDAEKIVEYVNSRDSRGETVMHYSSLSGHLNILELLYKSGGDLNARGFKSQTLLHRAASKCHMHIARFLVENISEDKMLLSEYLNAQDSDGCTAMQLAARAKEDSPSPV